MEGIVRQVDDWLRAGRRVAAATVVQVERSAPRGPGASMALNDRGEVAGSVSGGCVESDLYEHLRQVLDAGDARRIQYGIADEQGFEVGLSCGGTIHLFVERLDPASESWRAYAEALETGRDVTLATVLDGVAAGRRLAVTDGGVHGSTGDAALDRAVAAQARQRLLHGLTGLRAVDAPGADGAAAQEDGAPATVFFETRVRPARLFVFGAVDFARALCTQGKVMRYHVVACDARPVFATRERFPDADEVICRWPHEVLEEARLGPRDAVCVLTHDPKFDIPALQVALAGAAGYIGALGSRKTQARRREALLAAGVSEEQVARIAAPIGLDIGAATPEEFALAVMAEVVARRSGRSGAGLSQSGGPIHAGRAAAG